MKKQKGQAIILILIFLAVGALAIVPVMRYTATGLRAQEVTEAATARLYVADASVEAALSQMLSEILAGGSPATGNFTFELGSFSISAPTIPVNTEVRDPPLLYLMVQVIPDWLAAGQSVNFTYIIRVQHQKWPELDKFGLTLPSGLRYADNSTRERFEKQADLAPDASVNLTTNKIQMKNGQWVDMVCCGYNETAGALPPYLRITNQGRTLEWKRKDTDVKGNMVLIQKFTTTGTPGWGIHNTTLWLTASQTWEDTCTMGVAFYTVIVTVEGVTYRVIVAYDSTTGGFKIISYEVVG